MHMIPTNNQPCILIVDDDPGLCRLLVHLWQAEGYQAVSVASGMQALTRLKQGISGKAALIDLVLLDILMYGMDGVETCQRIRSDLNLISLPIIMLTAKGDLESRIEALEAGANDYLTKPFVRQELLARGQVWLQLGQEMRQRAAAEASLQRRHRELTALYRERAQLHAEARQMAEIERQRAAEIEQTLEKLRTTQEQLIRAERMRVLAETAAGVAHDFNHLLTIITNQVQALQKECSAGADTRGRLDAIIQAARDGTEVVRRFLDFGREREGAQFTPLDVNAIIQETVHLTRAQWQQEPARRGTPVELDLQLAEALPAVNGNPTQLREAYTNLILNAAQAMPQGGQLTIAAQRENDSVKITIQDTGVGMTPEVQERLFEPFFTTRGEQGTGLGLMVTQSIVVGHQGRMAVDSAPGEGTTFSIWLPVWVEPPAAPAESAPKAPRRARILIVDDEPFIGRFLRRSLEGEGYTVVIAQDGAAGLASFQPGALDLALVDLGLPDRSGWEVLRAIREQDAEIPLVLMSGWGAGLTAEEVKAAGANLALNKPFEFDELLDIIHQAMSKVASV